MKKKICIVSDNSKTCFKTERSLKEIGYISKPFKTFIQASLGIKQNKFDLLIFDINASQPLINQYLQELSEITKNRTIPIIIIANSIQEIEKIVGSECDIIDFLLKPFETSLLITRIKAIFSRLDYIENNLEKRLNKMRKEISSILPHEFRTSISGILGFSNILINEISDISKNYLPGKLNGLIEIAKSIQESGERLNKITENFLLYTQLNSTINGNAVKSLKDRNQETNAIELINDVVSALQNKILENNNIVIFDLDDGLALINYFHFYKVIYEITDNAIKFSKPNSKIIFKGKNYQISYNITITDEGRGMSKDQVEQIGAYKQFDRNVYEQQGAGLGLVIAKQIIQLYDGAFNIQSEKNNGTSIHISLPMTQNNNYHLVANSEKTITHSKYGVVREIC